MATPIRPKAVPPGATIAFISPSLRLNEKMPDVMARATAVLQRRGYKVRTFFSKDLGVQSCIVNRLEEIRAAFSDDTISAIICTIGGNTFTELLPALLADTELHQTIRQNPKVVVGYSDISGFHWFLHAITGLRTFYGPGAIPELGDVGSVEDEASPLAFCERNLFRAITTREPIGEIQRSEKYAPREPDFFREPASAIPAKLVPSPRWKWLRQGKGKGTLFGGCLSVVARLQGIRQIVPDWRGRIVFLETAPGDAGDGSGAPPYRVQSGFADLIAGGVFDDVAGLVVGRPYGYDTEEKRKQYEDIITSTFCEGPMASTKFPILFNIDIGHTTPIVTLPYDTLAELDSDNDSFRILEAAVA